MPDNDTPTKSEVKLLIENALLEQEKRLSKEFRDELTMQTNNLLQAIEKQNSLYSDNIIALNKTVTALEKDIQTLRGRLKVITAQIAIVGAVSATLGGFVGYLIDHL